jgi:ribosomal protein S18 acetylase RimI-like enzyme
VANQENGLLDQLDRFCDAVPRAAARPEELGDYVLFVRRSEGGWPFYARPRLGAVTAPAAADITTVRARQRELGLPESFEWIHEVKPDLLAVARSAGLDVQQAPLMVLEPEALPPAERFADLPVRLLDPDSPEFAADLLAWFAVTRAAFAPPAGPLSAPLSDPTSDAGNGSDPSLPTVAVEPPEIVTVTFPTVDSGVTHSPQVTPDAAPGTGSAAGAGGAGGTVGAQAVDLLPDDLLTQERQGVALGLRRIALADLPAPTLSNSTVPGPAAAGALNRVDGVAEIVGVGTLPAARRRGLASAVTAALARRALTDGVDLVFLAAGDDDSAVLYHRLGFRRVGTACIAAP